MARHDLLYALTKSKLTKSTKNPKNKGTKIKNKNLNPFFITVLFQVLQHAIELSSSLKR